MSHTKIRALQQWCKALVDGYKDVNITNMSSAWRDGLAFCALIHRFRPDLINFDALSKTNVYDNNQLAFTVAESLGIAALLEAKDMNDLPVPDKLSIITYVASMHNYFKDKERLGGPGVSTYKEGSIQIGTKRHQDNDPLNTTEPKRSTPDQSEEKIKKIGSSPTRQRSPADDLCVLCQKKVYLIEKQIDNGKLYHRSCFRGSHMSPTSKILSKSFSNGAALNDLSVPGINSNVERTANVTTCENSKSLTKVRLYEKRKEQIQKAEEKLKAEKQRENELYEKRQNTPSALRNHLKNINSETKTFKSSSDSSTSHSQFYSKQPSPQQDLGTSHNTTEQPSWAQTKLRKTFNDPASSKPSALSLEKERSSRKDFSVSTEEKQSRESSPSSPVLMMQVTSRRMEDKQHRASKSVTKSSTSLEAESGKQQVVSGLLKSLANIRQRQTPANTPSPTSSPPPPKSPSGPPPFSKLSTAQSTTSPMPAVANSLPFSQPLNSLPSKPAQTILKSTPLLDKTNDVKLQPLTDTTVTNQQDKSRSVARIKTVITSSPKNPATSLKTQPLTEQASTTSALSANSKVTNENASVPDSLTKPKASKKTTEASPLSLVSSTKTNITSKNSSSHPASLSKSNVSKVDTQSSPSRSASPAKSKVSQITSESSPSRSASPAKSKVSQITSESSPSQSVSSARSNLSKITAPPLQTDSPARLALSKAALVTSSVNTHTTDKLSMAKDNRPQSILERIEQYSKVAAGVEKPLSEQSPKREIIPGNNNDKQEDWQSSHKQNTFTTTSTTITPIAVKKPLASESTKEHNTVSRHITSPLTPKKMDNKSETVCLPPAVVKTYDKNGQTSSKAEITKEAKQPSLVPYLTSQSQPDKSSVTECSSKRLPHIKQVEEDKNSSKKEVSTSGACSIGLTKLHPAHYTPKLSDSSPKSTFEPSKTTATVSNLDMRVNPIPKPKRQKPGLIPNTTRENKENPIESNLSHSNCTNSHKTNGGALSERQDTGDASKTEWQLEAERRMAARKGKYVDPETRITRFVLPDSTTQLENEKNGDGNQNIRQGLKKISVISNLAFNSDDSLNSNTSLDFPYRKQILPKQDLDSLEWSNPKKQLSTDEIQKELMDIDSKLTDLELRGRQLEVSIRAANEEDEKFMVEWFQLINEKNELIRRENDLIYQSQEQELEEEQIQIDKELQALMQKPYEKKSKAEKRKEEELIQKKINVVNQRNLIVDSIDEDRLRYKEEDEGIKEVLQSKGYLGIEAPY